MKPPAPTVVVLDDDSSVLRSLERLLATRGYQVRAHAKPDEFFRAGLPEGPACLLLDQNLGDTKGTAVHAEMKRLGWDLATVFLTADGEVQTVVAAMRGGAVNYLTKPYDPVELLEVVAKCLERVKEEQQGKRELAELRCRAAMLTGREREVVALVAGGLLNKEIADRLNLAVVTVKVHRGRAMRKLGAGNPAELARIAEVAGLTLRE